MINFINLLCRKDGRIEPRKYLNLEISTDQLQILNLAEQDLRGSTTFQYAMKKSIRKLATRKLNVVGNMVGNCSVLTSEKSIKIDTEDMQIAATYEDITERQENSSP